MSPDQHFRPGDPRWELERKTLVHRNLARRIMAEVRRTKSKGQPADAVVQRLAEGAEDPVLLAVAIALLEGGYDYQFEPEVLAYYGEDAE